MTTSFPKLSSDTLRSCPRSPTLIDAPYTYTTYRDPTAHATPLGVRIQAPSPPPPTSPTLPGEPGQPGQPGQTGAPSGSDGAAAAPPAISESPESQGKEGHNKGLMARIWAAISAPLNRPPTLRRLQNRLVDEQVPLALQRSVSAGAVSTRTHRSTHSNTSRNMTRPSSWFVKKETTDPVDAAMLGKINVPGAHLGSPAVVVDAATLGAVNVPYGAKEEPKPSLVNLRADDLARVNVPTGEPLSRKASRTASPAPQTVEVKAIDLANVNQARA